MQKFIKKIFMISLGLVTLISTPAIINAIEETVHYKGVAVHWSHGRKLAIYSFSKVSTHVFKHSATANSTFSGWVSKDDGPAYAEEIVGINKAFAYWDCEEDD